MKLFSYLSVAVLLLSSIAACSVLPDLLSALIVGLMCIIALAGCIHGLLPTISITGGLLNGQKASARRPRPRAAPHGSLPCRSNAFFSRRRWTDCLRNIVKKCSISVRPGRSSAILTKCSTRTCWRCTHGKASSRSCRHPDRSGHPWHLRGSLLGLRGISFVTVEAALGSVQSILAGINTAFYTSIAGVILSILFNITNNVLRTIMNRETGLFLEEFHKSVIPTTDEQARYSSRREVRQILELLERLPRNAGNGVLSRETVQSAGLNERVLMPQILDGLRKNEFTFFLAAPI